MNEIEETEEREAALGLEERVLEEGVADRGGQGHREEEERDHEERDGEFAPPSIHHVHGGKAGALLAALVRCADQTRLDEQAVEHGHDCRGYERIDHHVTFSTIPKNR